MEIDTLGNEHLLRVRLGKPGSPVDLSLVEQLAEHLRGAFREIAAQLTGDGKLAVRFDVCDVASGSLILSLRPSLGGTDLVTAAAVTQLLIDDINAIAQDRPRPTMGTGLLNQYRGLLEVGERAGHLEFASDGTEAVIDIENRLAIESALSEQLEPNTSVVGHIETVNIHRRPWTFGLYTKLDRERVDCRFTESILEQVLSLMEAKALVEVTGEGRFGPAGVTPRQIEVSLVPQALNFDEQTLRTFFRSADLARAGESSADVVARVRLELGLSA